MHPPRVATVEHARARALTYLLLAIFVVAVYVAVVLGAGAAVGASDEHPNVALSVLATCIVAVTLEPLRRRVTPLARRLVGDTKPTPYETLGRLSRQTAGIYAIDEIAPRIAHVLATGTDATSAEVWLMIDESLRLSATWSVKDADSHASTSVRPAEASTESLELVADPPADAVVPVTDSEDLLGALVVRKAEGLTPVELGLVGDLARQAGLVLRNVILTRELEARVADISDRAAELTASRARLVAAQDEERRRLERDIHDGAQQHLVALVVQLRLVQALLDREPGLAMQYLHALPERLCKADQTIQDLIRGVYPPVLRERGLAAALREVETGVQLRVELEADDRRYPEEVEAAAYFSCVEAISNAAKHAAATTVRVAVHACAEELRFSVADDGGGFDPDQQRLGRGLTNIADRLETLGGTFRLQSTPGEGTLVEGRLPTTPAQVVPPRPEPVTPLGSDPR